MIAAIRDVDIPATVHSHARWTVHLTRPVTRTSDYLQQLAIGRKTLHTIVPPISYDQRVSDSIDRNAPRVVESPGFGTESTETRDMFPITGESFDPMVQGTDDPNIFVCVQGDSRWAVQLSGRFARGSPVAGTFTAYRVELCNHIGVFIGQVQKARAVDITHDRRRHGFSTNRVFFPRERGDDVIFVSGVVQSYSNKSTSGNVRSSFAVSVDNIQPSIRPDSHILWSFEPAQCEALTQ